MGKKQRGFIFSVPEPCHEKWDEMTPNEKGRHCASCNKTVIDFSLYSDQQLLDFISKQQGKVCGRFNNYQLDRPVTPTVPENPSILKRIAVGTAIAATLAACNDETTKTNPDFVKNITVGGLKPLPVTVDTSHNHCYIEGRVTTGKNGPLGYTNVKIDGTDFSINADSNGYYKLHVSDTLIGKKVRMIFTTSEGFEKYTNCKIDKLPFKKDFKIVQGDTFSVIGVTTGCMIAAPVSPELPWDSNKLFVSPDTMPHFAAFNKYIVDHIEYPKTMIDKNIEGTVYVSFVIEKDGAVSTVKVLKGVNGGSALDTEAVRVIRNMPNWKPGLQSGFQVRTQMNLPIRFVLSEKDSAKKG